MFKFLGVHVNDTLTWSDHVKKICLKVSWNLSLLRRLSWFLLQSLLLLYLKSYVIPTFDYCDVVWSGCTNDEAKCLETLLNLARLSSSPLKTLFLFCHCLLQRSNSYYRASRAYRVYCTRPEGATRFTTRAVSLTYDVIRR